MAVAYVKILYWFSPGGTEEENENLKLGNAHFLPYPFQFIIR
jgi:hypothetical protein